MRRRAVDRIAAATLYEGYLLYPYRLSSVKNRIRWTFGVVYPRAYAEACAGSEAWMAQTECLLRDAGTAQVSLSVRFLHPVERWVARLVHPMSDPGGLESAALQAVDELEASGVTHRPAEEATEREIACGRHAVEVLVERAVDTAFSLPAAREVELLRDGRGLAVGALVRDSAALAAAVRLQAERLPGDLVRVRAAVSNTSDLATDAAGDRVRALRHSLAATHVILEVEGGRWLSLADPPDDACHAAQECRNIGLWPVLVGEPGSADTILAAPIILEDHPQVAAESSGDLFDATEIDEILSLRILTLTDEEKAEMRAADLRARTILERTEAITPEGFMRLHGTIRELRPVEEGCGEP
jgi:hypothetical protein